MRITHYVRVGRFLVVFVAFENPITEIPIDVGGSGGSGGDTVGDGGDLFRTVHSS